MFVTRSRSGLTLIEVAIALVVVSILGALTVAGVSEARERGREAEMRSELRTFTEQQQEHYGHAGRYEAFSDLQRDEGSTLTGKVVLDSTGLSADGERTYLRVRHLETNKKCSVDFSRSSPNAINRIRCFVGRDVVPPEGPAVVAIADTFHTPPDTTTPPPVPGPPGSPTLLPPVVSNPGNQSAAPGAAMSQTFQVTNQSSEARTYSFGVTSSSPSVVPPPAAPGTATIVAGGTVDVTIAYGVSAAAEASAASTISLSATDVDQPGLNGRGSFTFSTNLVLLAPTLTSPPDIVVDPGSDFTIAWDAGNGANAPRVLTAALLGALPADITNPRPALAGDVSFAARESKSAAVTYTLSAAAEGGQTYSLGFQVADEENPSLKAVDAVNVTARLILLAPMIVRDPVPASVNPGQSVTVTYTVTNRSNQTRVLNIVTAPMTGDLSWVNGSNGGNQTLPKGGSIAVTTIYQLAATSVAGTVSGSGLVVTDVSSPANPTPVSTSNFTVSTGLVELAPTVTGPADVNANPGDSGVGAFVVVNRTNASRTFSFTPGSTVSGVVPVPGAPASVTIPAFGMAPVTENWSVAAQAVAGASSVVSLRATDNANAALTASVGFLVTTNLVLVAPLVTGDPTVVYTAPGGNRVLQYTVQNRSNANRLFDFPATSSMLGTVADPVDPASQSIPAFGSVVVSVTGTMNAAAMYRDTSRITLRATDNLAPAYTGSGSAVMYAAEVDLAPQITKPVDQVVAPGNFVNVTWSIYNPSNYRRDYTIAQSVTGGLTTGGYVNIGGPFTWGARVGGLGSTVKYTVPAGVRGGTTYTATLSATDPGVGSDSKSFTIRTPDVTGCMDPAATNYNALANVAGACTYKAGCTDPTASNFDPTARVNDGSCFWLGCTRAWAENYNARATRDDGSCYLHGCTSNWADNYNANATINDGTCYRSGCTQGWADNYDSWATRDDGSCRRGGCTNSAASNYDPQATYDNGSCVVSPPPDVTGCMDPASPNFNPSATLNDQSMCGVKGCMDPVAQNYNAAAIYQGNAVCTYGITLHISGGGNIMPKGDPAGCSWYMPSSATISVWADATPGDVVTISGPGCTGSTCTYPTSIGGVFNYSATSTKGGLASIATAVMRCDYTFIGGQQFTYKSTWNLSCMAVSPAKPGDCPSSLGDGTMCATVPAMTGCSLN